ncbi:outer membrane protein 15 [Anaplasma marginale str. Florida]|uniref:Outer membrane protein 15 n=1 Tax=Anaplasma marginale (strain Florida) TaxID=320483 RepID=B9KGN3_ANAMF|nr:outer membrane protein 15 [Anaplasma marginale str. Florida]
MTHIPWLTVLLRVRGPFAAFIYPRTSCALISCGTSDISASAPDLRAAKLLAPTHGPHNATSSIISLGANPPTRQHIISYHLLLALSPTHYQCQHSSLHHSKLLVPPT